MSNGAIACRFSYIARLQTLDQVPLQGYKKLLFWYILRLRPAIHLVFTQALIFLCNEDVGAFKIPLQQALCVVTAQSADTSIFDALTRPFKGS